MNKETVSLEPVEHKYDVATLKELIRAHVEATGSPRGKEILDNFSAFLPKFKKVLPYDYDRMLRVIASVEERGLDGEQAQIEAFYAVQEEEVRRAAAWVRQQEFMDYARKTSTGRCRPLDAP